MANFFKFLGNIIDRKYLIYIIVGLVMIFLFVFSDIFYNQLSHYIFGFASPLFILLSFLLILIGIISYLKVPLNIKQKQNTQNEMSEEKEEKESYTLEIDEKKFSIIYRIIVVLSFVFVISNCLSAAFYFLKPILFKEKFTTEKNQIEDISRIVSNFSFSEGQMIDSITKIVPQNVFQKGGIITKFSIDSTGNYIYNFSLKTKHNIKDTTINFLDVIVANNTDCNISDFCNCDSVNICLENASIDFYKLFIFKEDLVIDTLNFVRINKL